MKKEKHIPTQAEVLEVLTELATQQELSNFKIGLFGSYARNNYSSRSDIDIIFRELNEPENPLSALSTTAFIRKFIREKLHKSVELLEYYDVYIEDSEDEEDKEASISVLRRAVDSEVIWIGCTQEPRA